MNNNPSSLSTSVVCVKYERKLRKNANMTEPAVKKSAIVNMERGKEVGQGEESRTTESSKSCRMFGWPLC